MDVAVVRTEEVPAGVPPACVVRNLRVLSAFERRVVRNARRRRPAPAR